MNNKNTEQRSFFDNIKRYVDLKFEDAKMSLVEKISVLVGHIVLMLCIALFSVVLLALFLVVMNDILLYWVNIPWLASLILFGFALIIFGLVWIYRRKLIINPVTNSIIRAILEKKEEEE